MMNKGLPIFGLALLLAGQAFSAPTLVWSNTLAGTTADGGDFFTFAGVDGSGNSYAVGTVFNGASPNEFADIAIVKYNPAGVAQWTRIYDRNGFDDVAYDAKVDSAGNVYVCGYSALDNTATNTDVLALKVSTANAIVYATTYVPGAQDVDEYSYKLALTGAGECYIAGEAGATGAVPYDAALFRVSSAGVFDWRRTFAGTGNDYDALGDVSVASNGDAVACGLMFNTNYDGLVVRVTSANTLVFSDTFASAGSTFMDDEATSLALNSTGDAFVVGTTFKEDTPILRQEAWVRRYSPAGTVAFTTIYDGNATGITTGRDIAVDASSNCYFVGETTVGGTNDSNADQYISKVNGSGGSAGLATRDGGFGDFFRSVGLLSNGNVVASGYSFLDGSAVPADCNGVLGEYNPSTLAEVSLSTFNGVGNDWDQWHDMTVSGGSVFLTGFTYQSFTNADALANRYDFSVLIAPASYTILQGTFFGGSIASLANSDNDKLFILLDEIGPNSEAVFTAAAPGSTASSMKCHVEFSGSRNDLSCFTSAFNYVTNSYTSLDFRTSTLADVAFTATVPGTVSNYIGAGNEIKGRILTIPQADIEAGDGWTFQTDRFNWEIQ